MCSDRFRPLHMSPLSTQAWINASSCWARMLCFGQLRMLCTLCVLGVEHPVFASHAHAVHTVRAGCMLGMLCFQCAC